MAYPLRIALVTFWICSHSFAQLRPLTTDRPDKTESPYSVDAGHFQFETDFASYITDTSAGVQTRTWLINNINLKAGLTDFSDIQLILETLKRVSTTTGGTETVKTGFGDITVRFKVNLLGNDEGALALGIMPLVKIPTNGGGVGNRKWEGGVIFAGALELPSDFSLGGMFQYNRSKNTADDNFHSDFITTLAVGHPIVATLAGYAEFFGKASDEAGAGYAATFDMGLTYIFSEHWQLDAGVNIGITDAADDLNPFLGLSAKF